jgi:hypothetical protein
MKTTKTKQWNLAKQKKYVHSKKKQRRRKKNEYANIGGIEHNNIGIENKIIGAPSAAAAEHIAGARKKVF